MRRSSTRSAVLRCCQGDFGERHDDHRISELRICSHGARESPAPVPTPLRQTAGCGCRTERFGALSLELADRCRLACCSCSCSSDSFRDCSIIFLLISALQRALRRIHRTHGTPPLARTAWDGALGLQKQKYIVVSGQQHDANTRARAGP